jgi:primary-amine oxidase
VFATKNLWVTPYAEGEKWPAGDYTIQSPGGKGLPEWTAKNRCVKDVDVVMWHCFGVTHVVREEDFPVSDASHAVLRR